MVNKTKQKSNILDLLSNYLLTTQGFQQAKICLPAKVFESIYQENLREDSDEHGEPGDAITPFQFGRNLLSEKIKVSLVEKIDL